MITFNQIRRIAVRWAKSRNLNVEGASAMPFHDYIHATLGLREYEEGLVLATEYLVAGKIPYPEFWEATGRQLALYYGVDVTDNYTSERAAEVLIKAQALLPQLKEAKRAPRPAVWMGLHVKQIFVDEVIV